MADIGTEDGGDRDGGWRRLGAGEERSYTLSSQALPARVFVCVCVCVRVRACTRLRVHVRVRVVSSLMRATVCLILFASVVAWCGLNQYATKITLGKQIYCIVLCCIMLYYMLY